jgi:hypothetical protein
MGLFGELPAMNKVISRVCTILLGSMVAGTFSFASSASAQTVDLLPNLKPLPASNISLVPDFSVPDGSTLRFSTTSWNSGAGPLELVAGEVETGSGKQKVHQRVYLSDGTSFLHYAGSFEYHPQHNHFHFGDFAIYTLQPVNAPGGSLRTGSKTTFCVIDTDKINGNLPGAPTQAVYTVCNNQVQGMSVGWGDTYGSHLSGQELDFTGNPDGIYQLKIDVDPKKLLLESNENDNVSCVLLSIENSTVSVLDNSGGCTAVQSITPNTAGMGTSVSVTITGFGFTSGMSVTFEGGNGPRPVASNVVLTHDTDAQDMITATVTVPSKRKLGRDSVWDLRVGTVGVLPNAFTVNR